MSIEAIRDLVSQLSASASALAALSAELQARCSGRQVHAAVRPHVDDLLRNCGAFAALQETSPDELRPLVAELRHSWLLDHDFLMNPERGPGWNHTDPATLSSAGEVTEGFPNALAAKLAPSLEGLSARLDGGGSFLDVGVGVGRLALAMARRFPKLRVVGIDTWGPALALAKKNVADAGLGDRIELREQAGERLPEDSAFDLAWLPGPFIPPAAVAPLLERVHRSLKPGGWLLFVTVKSGDDLAGAALRLRAALFGGQGTTPAEVEKLLADKGYTQVRALPGPPKDYKVLIAARRAP